MGPKKYLGQHFLTSVSHAKRIAESISALPDEKVLEIGPGRGALSIHLKARFPEFHCVEIDDDVIPLLKAKLGDGAWTLHRHDVLTFDFAAVGFPLHVTGNLPYSIGAHIIKKTLLYGSDIRSCTFMVQREVAQRIVAKPHSKQNGFLSIFCQFFGKPVILFHVPPGAFFPKPAVDSSVFRICIETDPQLNLARGQWDDFFSFVDKGFSQRRKILVNTLATYSSKEQVAMNLAACGIAPLSRPEDLDVKQWLALFKTSFGIL